MTRSAKLTILMVSAIMLGSAFPVLACSVEYVATPDELVADADAIHRVRAIGEAVFLPGQRISSIAPQVDFIVLETIKGQSETAVRIDARLVDTEDPNDGAIPYTFVRAGGRGGNCFATTYKLGSEYLFFMKDGVPYWAPLAPTNEEVAGSSDPWVIWVRQAVKKSGGAA